MTNEERRKAAEWFRNRAKNCPMPGTRRMYEIATEALEMAIRALEGDGDMISRQAVMVVFENSGLDDDSKDTVVRVLEQLPSAQPQRKKGKWCITPDGKLVCSNCYENPTNRIIIDGELVYDMTPIKGKMKFCPNCGVRMDGESE